MLQKYSARVPFMGSRFSLEDRTRLAKDRHAWHLRGMQKCKARKLQLSTRNMLLLVECGAMLLFLGHLSSAASPGYEPQLQTPGRPDAPDVGDGISQKLPADFRFHQVFTPFSGDLNDPGVHVALSNTASDLVHLCPFLLEYRRKVRSVPRIRTHPGMCGSHILRGLSALVRRVFKLRAVESSAVHARRIKPYEFRASPEQLMYRRVSSFIWERFCRRCPITPNAIGSGGQNLAIYVASHKCYYSCLSAFLIDACNGGVSRTSVHESRHAIGSNSKASGVITDGSVHPRIRWESPPSHIDDGLISLLTEDGDADLLGQSSLNDRYATVLNWFDLVPPASGMIPSQVSGIAESPGAHEKSSEAVGQTDSHASSDADTPPGSGPAPPYEAEPQG